MYCICIMRTGYGEVRTGCSKSISTVWYYYFYLCKISEYFFIKDNGLLTIYSNTEIMDQSN